MHPFILNNYIAQAMDNLGLTDLKTPLLDVPNKYTVFGPAWSKYSYHKTSIILIKVTLLRPLPEVAFLEVKNYSHLIGGRYT